MTIFIDAMAARGAGMIAIGVLWGSHSLESLKSAEFDYLCETVEQLQKQKKYSESELIALKQLLNKTFRTIQKNDQFIAIKLLDKGIFYFKNEKVLETSDIEFLDLFFNTVNSSPLKAFLQLLPLMCLRRDLSLKVTPQDLQLVHGSSSKTVEHSRVPMIAGAPFSNVSVETI